MTDTTDTTADTTDSDDAAAENEGHSKSSTPDGKDVHRSDTHGDDGDGQGDDDRGGNSEAAKWRHKTRDAETERDSAHTQLDNQRTAILHRLAAAAGVTPALLEASNVKVADLLDDDDLLDHDAASAVVEKVRSDNGLPRRPAPNGNQGNSRLGADAKRSWSDVIGGNVRTSK